MHKITRKLMGKFDITAVLGVTIAAILGIVVLMGVIGMLGTHSISIGKYAQATSTSEFGQTINVGTLSVDIKNSSWASVGSPTVTMDAITFSYATQDATGHFGAAEQRVWFENPDASDTGFLINLAAQNTTDVWDSAGTDFDFNDAGGYTDDGATTDADSLGGEMTIDASAGTVNQGQYGDSTTGVVLQAADAFEEGTTDSITIVNAGATSDDIGDWYVIDADITQKIPAEQPAADDYTISMCLDIVAQ